MSSIAIFMMNMVQGVQVAEGAVVVQVAEGAVVVQVAEGAVVVQVAEGAVVVQVAEGAVVVQVAEGVVVVQVVVVVQGAVEVFSVILWVLAPVIPSWHGSPDALCRTTPVTVLPLEDDESAVTCDAKLKLSE